MNTIIGKKTEQTQAFLTNGVRVPVTRIDVSDNTVLEVKTQDKHGYSALQIGYGSRKNSRKSILGHIKKADLKAAPKLILEARLDSDAGNLNVGDRIDLESVLKPGDIVKVTGISKGKGFAGVVKRHNFRGGPRTHGQSDRERAPGSIGQTTTPGRVYRGKRMAGRMGNERSSALNLLVVGIDVKGDKKTVLVKGLVPGVANSLVTVQKTGELPDKKFVPLVQDEVIKENPVESEVEVREESVSSESADVKDEAVSDSQIESDEIKTEEASTADETKEESPAVEAEENK